ncbi:MAG: hypothetical protein RL701_6505 [Pseudomonadota bacterium]|jgi:FMN phosphatase YigB (HAD superfamily)
MTTQPAKTKQPVVFLLDVDNTLLDNDRVIADLRGYLGHELGESRAQQYFAVFERRREQLGYADYLGALQDYRSAHPRDPHVLAVSSFLINYPFADRLFEGALAVVRHLTQWGPTVILSDGDAVFQPWKVERSGLFSAVDKRILIYIHKEHELDDVELRFPAEHYVLVDDKVRILSAVKAHWGSRVTSVFPRQGHYATASDVGSYPKPDLTIETISELLQCDLTQLLHVARG